MRPTFSAAGLDGPGTWTVGLRVTDDYGATAEDTATINILNVAPTTTITGAPAESPEGTRISLASSVIDPGILDRFTYAWSVTKNGDQFAAGTNAGFIFTPDDNGTYVVTLTVTDDDGGVGTDSRTVAATNVDPTATVTGAPTSSPEGTAISLGGTETDPSSVDMEAGFTYAWGVTKNGSPYGSGTAASFSFTPDDNGTYVVSLTATDKDGGASATATRSIGVANVAPTVAITGAPDSSPEGTEISLGSVVTDPSSVDTAAGFIYAWSVTKNGSAYAGGTAATFSFTPDDGGSYVVSLTITDKDGGSCAAAAESIAVTNVAPAAPVVTGISEDRGAAGDGITSDNTLVISGTADANSTVELFQDSVSIGTTTASGSGVWSFDYTATSLADGTYNFTATAEDADGDTSAVSAAFVVQVDTVAPVVTVDTLTTTDATPALTGMVDDPHAAVTVTILSHSYVATNKGDGTWTLPAGAMDAAIPVGIYDVAVQATDVAGNAGTDATTNELTVYLVGDMNWDGIVSIVGDILPFVRVVYFGDYDWYQQHFPGKNPLLPGDFNGDGVLSIVGDVPAFVDYVYFGRTPAPSPTGPAFAQFPGQLDTPGSFTSVDFQIGSKDFALNRQGTVGLSFHLYATGGGGFDPDVVEILDSQNQPIAPLYTQADLPGGTDSLTLCYLSYGRYELRIRGQNRSTGNYCLDVSLIGDADGDHNIDGSDTLLLQSAFGSRAGETRYVAAADADEDGVVGSFDLAQEIRNLGAVTTLTPLHLTAALSPAPTTTTAEGVPLTDQPAITVVGQTNPGLTVELDIDGDGYDDGTVTATSTGTYAFSLFTLIDGMNNIRVRAADSFGQIREVPLTVVLQIPLHG
jgi:hypothetical protein